MSKLRVTSMFIIALAAFVLSATRPWQRTFWMLLGFASLGVALVRLKMYRSMRRPPPRDDAKPPA